MGHESEEPEPEEPAEKPAPASNPAAGRWTVGGLVVLAVLVLTCCVWRANRPSDTSSDQSYSATVACEGFVKNQLKAPATAKFSGELAAAGDDNATWTVTGSVDAQNSFGALLRSTFTCVIHDQGASWHLQSLTGLS